MVRIPVGRQCRLQHSVRNPVMRSLGRQSPENRSTQPSRSRRCALSSPYAVPVRISPRLANGPAHPRPPSQARASLESHPSICTETWPPWSSQTRSEIQPVIAICGIRCNLLASPECRSTGSTRPSNFPGLPPNAPHKPPRRHPRCDGFPFRQRYTEGSSRSPASSSPPPRTRCVRSCRSASPLPKSSASYALASSAPLCPSRRVERKNRVAPSNALAILHPRTWPRLVSMIPCPLRAPFRTRRSGFHSSPALHDRSARSARHSRSR